MKKSTIKELTAKWREESEPSTECDTAPEAKGHDELGSLSAEAKAEMHRMIEDARGRGMDEGARSQLRECSEQLDQLVEILG